MNGNATQSATSRRTAPRPRLPQPDPAASGGAAAADAERELGQRLARIYRFLLLRSAESPEQPAEAHA